MLRIINGKPYIQTGYAEICISEEDIKELFEWHNNQNYVYIRNGEKYIGNALVWWKTNGEGYTIDIKEAGMFTLEDAKKRTSRPEDTFFPVNYINSIQPKHIIENVDFLMRIKKDSEVK